MDKQQYKNNVRTNFQQWYSKLEELTKELGCETMYEFSRALNDRKTQDKLKICNDVRNYISHHPDNFIEPNDAMVRFLDWLIAETQKYIDEQIEIEIKEQSAKTEAYKSIMAETRYRNMRY